MVWEHLNKNLSFNTFFKKFQAEDMIFILLLKTVLQKIM